MGAAAGAARDAHALAVLLDLDFGQAGFVQELGELMDQRRDRPAAVSAILPYAFSVFFALAPTRPASPVIASA